MAEEKRFGRLRMPVISLYIHTEHSSFKITDDTKSVANQPTSIDSDGPARSILSFKTTNAMSDDSATFSIVLGPKDGILWDRVINSNDLVEILIDNNEDLLNTDKHAPKNNAVMVGLVSEVAILGDHSSDSKMYQITGQSIAKVFSQYKVGLVSEVEEQLSPMGWLWDSGISDAFYMQNGSSDGSSSSGSSDSSDDSGVSGSWTKSGTEANANAQAVWDYWVGKGFSGASAAGVLGNVYAESSFDPKAVQESEDKGNKNNPAKITGSTGTHGYGLYQVSPGSKYGKWSGYTSPTITNESDYMWKAYGGARISKGIKNYKNLISLANQTNPKDAALKFYGAVENGNTGSYYTKGAGTKRDNAAQKAYTLFGGKSVKYSKSKLKSAGATGGSSSGSSTSGSTSTSSNTGSTMTQAQIDKEKQNSEGVAFYGNSVKGVETNLLQRFEKYITYSYDNGKYNVWNFLSTSIDSWTDDEKMTDSSNFVNFTGSLYELQTAVLRKPFNEMFYDFNTSTGKTTAKLIIRRTPFNPEDWYALDMFNADSSIVLSEEISRSDREQYSVFVDNPATGWFMQSGDSLTIGSYPRTKEDLIKKYGYSKLEVSDYYVSGSNDKDWSVTGNGTAVSVGSNGGEENLLSIDNEQGSMFDFAAVQDFLKGYSRNVIDQQTNEVAQKLANQANNISMNQALSIVGMYRNNAYVFTSDMYAEALDTANGGGQANTGTHKVTYKAMAAKVKSAKDLRDFLMLCKPYFKNVSDEELTGIWNIASNGKLSKKEYDKAMKQYNGAGSGSSGDSSSVDMDTTKFQTILYNWYANNSNFWSGTYTILGNPDVRLGMIFNYSDNYLASKYKYPGRRFYIESVSHNFSFTEGYTTEVGVTRGLIAPTPLSAKSDVRFSQKYNWGDSEPYKGGYMGEATTDLLAYSEDSSSGSDSGDDSDLSGANGPATAVSALATALKYNKETYHDKTEIYALGGYGERGKTNPLTNSINGNNLVLDCSSFVYWCFYSNGLKINQTVATIVKDSHFKKVNIPAGSTKGMKKGDLVIMHGRGHVKIYAGGGKAIGWDGGGAGTNKYWDPNGGCKLRKVTTHDGYVMRLKG